MAEKHYRDRFLDEAIGPKVLALAKRVKASVRLKINGDALSADHIVELGEGTFVVPQESLEGFVFEVSGIGGYLEDPNYKTIVAFLGGRNEHEDEEKIIVTPPSPVIGDDDTDSEIALGSNTGDIQVLESDSPVRDTDTVVLPEVEWLDEHRAKLGERVFDINDKVVRSSLVGHIRASKGDLTWKSLIESAELNSRATGWFTGVEKGVARITSSEIIAIAAACEVSVGVLFTGNGLDKSKMIPHSVARSSAPVALTIPNISHDQMQEYFRERVCNVKVEPAEGIAFGKLMELAIHQDGVDWVDAFLMLTKRGEKMRQEIQRDVEELKKVADPAKVLILTKIVKGLWPQNEE